MLTSQRAERFPPKNNPVGAFFVKPNVRREAGLGVLKKGGDVESVILKFLKSFSGVGNVVNDQSAASQLFMTFNVQQFHPKPRRGAGFGNRILL